MSANSAHVIKIGDRYFYGFGKGNRVLTAWSLAGSELFGAQDKLNSVKNKLDELGKKYEILIVEPRLTVAQIREQNEYNQFVDWSNECEEEAR